MDNLVKFASRGLITCLLITVPLGLYFFVTSPVAFQKSVSIVSVTQHEFAELVTNSELLNPNLNIPSIIQDIPYNNGEMVYEVLPEEMFNKSIKAGNGNCSNLSFGLAYQLIDENHKCQIVHFLPIECFLMGEGHTVTNTTYWHNDKRYNGIVDVIEGGVPFRGSKALTPIDLLDIENKWTDIQLISLNNRKDSLSPYYSEEFVKKCAIGVIPQSEIKQYFNFMTNWYTPVFSSKKKLEKIVFNGLAVVFGAFPDIIVTESDYERLYEGNNSPKFLAFTLLFSLRVMLVLILFTILIKLWRLILKIRKPS